MASVDNYFDHFKEREDEVIAFLGTLVTSNSKVADLSMSAANAITETISKGILRRNPQTEQDEKAIKFSKGEDGVIIDIYIDVKYGVNIPQLAWELQGLVKNSVQGDFHIPVNKVNIRVQGVVKQR